MTDYPDHLAIAKKLLDQQGEINRLTAERDRCIALLTAASDALCAVGKAAITVEPILKQPYPDAPETSPWGRFVEPHVRRAYNLGRQIRRELRAPASSPEFPLPIRADGSHTYLSTGCLHGSMILPDGRTGHEYCQGETGACGTKTPAVCKFCGSPCQCPCHAPSCRWPACLSEAEQQQVADDVGASMRGEETVPGPDPRPGCGCVDRGLVPGASPVWLLRAVVTAPTPEDAERWTGGIAEMIHAEFGEAMRLDVSIAPLPTPATASRTTPDKAVASEDAADIAGEP